MVAKHRWAWLAAIVAISILGSFGTAAADWIILKNGTFFRGQIEERDNGKIKIRLDGGGTRTISEADLLAVESDLPFNDRLAAGNRELSRTPPAFEAACRHFFIAKQEQWNNPDANMGYILCLDGLGQSDEALKLARQMAFLHPAHARLKLAYGELLSKSGDYTRAEQMIRDASALEPLNQGVQTLVADALRRNQNRKNNRAGTGNNGGNAGGNAMGFDRTLGNTMDAAEMTLDLLNWARSPDETHAKAFLAGLLVGQSSPEAERALAQGRTDEYRVLVHDAEFRVKVDEDEWLRLKPPMATYSRLAEENLRERKLTLLGWYYQIKKRYPNATVRLVVKADRRGRREPVTVASAKWDGRLNRVTFEFNER